MLSCLISMFFFVTKLILICTFESVGIPFSLVLSNIYMRNHKLSSDLLWRIDMLRNIKYETRNINTCNLQGSQNSGFKDFWGGWSAWSGSREGGNGV